MPLFAFSPQLNSTCSLKSSYFPSFVSSGPFPGVISSPFSTFQTFSEFGSLIVQPVRSFLLNSSIGFPHFAGFVRTNAGAACPVHCHVLPSGPFTVPDKFLPASAPSKTKSARAPSSSFGETKVSFPFESSAFGSGRAFPQRPTNCATKRPLSWLSSSHEGYSRLPSFNVKSHRPRKAFADSPAGAAGALSNARERAYDHAPTDSVAIAKAKTRCRIFMRGTLLLSAIFFSKEKIPQQFPRYLLLAPQTLPPPDARIHRRRGLPRNQLRRHRKLFRIVLESLHALQQNPRRRFAHVAQRLTNRRQPRSVIRRHLNIVKSNHRHVFRDAQIRVPQRANRSNRRDIIKRHNRRKSPPLLKQLLHHGIAQLRGSQVALQLNRQVRTNFQPQFSPDAHNALPAVVRVRAERLPAHERDPPMPELVQMPQRQFRRALVIQHYVRHSRNFPVTRHRHHWHWQRVRQRRIYCDQPFRAAPQQQSRILLDHVRLVPVMRAEIKVALAHQMVADAAHHHGVVSVAQLRNEHAHGERPLLPQRTRQQARLIIEFPRRRSHALARLRGNRPPRHIVQHYRYCRRAQSQIVCQNFQADGLLPAVLTLLASGHGRLRRLFAWFVENALQGLHKHSLKSRFRLDVNARGITIL